MNTTSQVVLPLARQIEGRAHLLGTCFALGGKYLATALHVVGPSDDNLVLIMPKVLQTSDYQDATNTMVSMSSVRMVAADPFRDLCIIEVLGDVAFNVQYGIAGSDEVPPGAGVVIFGYPHANHGRMIFTMQASTVGARVLLGTEVIKNKHIVINSQVRPGQSGSPVFSQATGNVCAVVTGSYAPREPGLIIGDIDPATLHQTAHAVSAEYLKGMLP